MSGVTSVSTVGSSTPSSSTLAADDHLAPSATASSIHDLTRSRSLGEMSADTSVASSSGSPTTSVDTSRDERVEERVGDRSCWTSTRWVEMQDWPAWLNPATEIFVAAVVQSPSGSMITGALLPSSRPTFLRGAGPRIPQPTSGEPVNVIIAMSGWSTMALPTVAPAAGDDVEPLRRQPALVDAAARRARSRRTGSGWPA